MIKINYDILQKKLRTIVEENNLFEKNVVINAKSLTAVEAIGNPERRDYPIIKGKEKLMQAEFNGAKGQAFTDMPGDYSGSIRDVLDKKLETNFDRAVFIATLNAVCSYLGLCEGSIHCKDEEPEDCGSKLVKYVKEKYDNPKIALVGFQPALLNHLTLKCKVRVLDMDQETIGKMKYGVKVEDGETKTEEVLEWCDLILATGSTLTNDSIATFIGNKPVVFYGTTVAAAASLMNLDRFCPCSH